jgi:integrase
MTFKIFARKDKLSEKGVPLVFILEPGKRKISTGFHCKENSWNQQSQSVIVNGPKKDPKATVTNIGLKKASIKLQELIDEGCTVEQMRAGFQDQVAKIQAQVKILRPEEYVKLTSAGKAFYSVVELLIHSHASDWTEGYKKRFRSIRTKILWYEPNFRMEMLTEDWWRGFVTWCIEELDNVSNTINTDTKTLEALKSELGVNTHQRLKWGYIEPQILALSWDKVLKLDTPDLIAKIQAEPIPTLNDSRIKWLAGAFTGRRWEEIDNLGPSNFYQKKGEWRYRNIGKGNKLVDIRLLPEAVEFFKQINFTIPRLTNQQVNEDIKTICKIAGYELPTLVITPISANKVKKEVVPEYKTVHFHTGRHSYGQHIAEMAAGEPYADKFVSDSLGHASYATTWRYMNRSASNYDAMFDKIIKKS